MQKVLDFPKLKEVSIGLNLLDSWRRKHFCAFLLFSVTVLTYAYCPNSVVGHSMTNCCQSPSVLYASLSHAHPLFNSLVPA